MRLHLIKPFKQAKLYYLHPKVENELDVLAGQHGNLTKYFDNLMPGKGKDFAQKVVTKMKEDIPDSHCIVEDDGKIIYQTDEKNVLCAVYLEKDENGEVVHKILRSNDLEAKGQNGR